MGNQLKYVLLSSVVDVNQQIIDVTKEQINGDSKVVYVRGKPSSSSTFFTNVCNFYRQLGIDNVQYYDLDRDCDQYIIAAIKDCDIIHFGGGNTYTFNHRIKEGNYFQVFYELLTSDRLVIGESAGAIVLTRDIGITAILGEENKSLDTSGLGLLDFQLLPHYNSLSPGQVALIDDYQSISNGPIIVVNDGGGVLVDAVNVTLIDSSYIN